MGGPVQMPQWVVTYEFVDGITWSDGVPVSQADYELAYRGTCDPAIRGEGPVDTQSPEPFPVCGQIAGVEFLGDTAYRVTWKPGTSELTYAIPPFSRLPAHRELSDGRRLADVPASELATIDELPATPNIVIRFAARDEMGHLLEAGQVDVIGWESVDLTDAPALMRAQAAGNVQVYVTPGTVYQQLDFALVSPQAGTTGSP
jgi:hypothetical protein